MSQQSLKRELGLFGATLMGLGSIVGSGVFVSIGVAAGVVGPAVVLAIGVAAFVATCNALSSAQLAASHPVSGGTYEYGYRYLNPRLGFMAAWLFLLAKSASAATAALGFAGYTLHLAGTAGQSLRVPLALGAVLVLTLITLRGVRRSNTANTLIVSVTLVTLALFVLAGLGEVRGGNFRPFFQAEDGQDVAAFLQACALMFVAYTGYGRIATLGEEVTNPRQTIPRAILSTLVVTMVLYLAVACVAVGTVSPQTLSEAAKNTAAPLEAAAATFSFAPTQSLVALGAITAMLGVLLNLILGLSRVLLAMGRRGDMPKATARINETLSTPSVAVGVMGALIALLVLTGNVRTTWSFSAFNVLLYYALTNLAALRLPPEHRLYPRFFAYAGLGACAFLAFWVEPQIWAVGLGLLALGWLWQTLARRLNHATGG
jgi:APA family basic amino acid/polyamine antiporter